MKVWVKNGIAIILVALAIAAVARLYMTNPFNPCSCSRMGDRLPRTMPGASR